MKTHTSDKCRKYNSPRRYRAESTQCDRTSWGTIVPRFFYALGSAGASTRPKPGAACVQAAMSPWTRPHAILIVLGQSCRLAQFSGRGEIPHRRYAALPRARERLPKGRVSRSGARPEPTVIVRMEENERVGVPEGALRCARDRLG